MTQAAAPEIIFHRRNTIALLEQTPREFGVEMDVRSRGSRLVIHHDAFAPGEDFEAWLGAYRHGTLILNVKEEGLEDRLLQLLADARIDRFFFLDQSFPFLIRTVRTGERRCAVRVSEYEAPATALSLGGLADWIWLDSFTGGLPGGDDLARLAGVGFRTCLVSPELQGRDAAFEVPRMRAYFDAAGFALAAVCTKVPELWT